MKANETNTKFRRFEYYQRGSKKRGKNAVSPTPVRLAADIVVEEDVSIVNQDDTLRANQGVRLRTPPSRVVQQQQEQQDTVIISSSTPNTPVTPRTPVIVTTATVGTQTSPMTSAPSSPLASPSSPTTAGSSVTTKFVSLHPRRRNPECRARPEDPAPRNAVVRTGYRRRIDFTQALPYCPVSARNVPEAYPHHTKDEQHMRFNNKWNSSKMPRALNYGDYLGSTCDFYEYSQPHPDEEVRRVYRSKYRCIRPYGIPRVETEGGTLVGVCSMPQYTPKDYSHIPPQNLYKTVVCFRNVNFARMKVLDSDLTDLIMLYTGFAGATVYNIEPLEVGEGKHGLGQVRVVLDGAVEFGQLLLKRPCIIDHNGVFVLKAEHANDDHYPKELIEKPRKNKPPELLHYPVEFMQLIKMGDQLS